MLICTIKELYGWILAVVAVFIFAGCLPQEAEEPLKEPIEIKAVYIGRIDPSFIEILNGEEFGTYAFGQDEEAAVEADGIESYSAVDIVFVVDGEGQKHIESMELADLPGVGNAPEMEMEGQIEEMIGATVCMIEGEPYWLAYELLLSSSKFVEEGDYIDFDYYADDYGRKVITSYLKIFTECGRFDGIKGTTISVKLSGNPDEIEAKKYLLSTEIAETMESLQLKIGEVIRFRYIVGQEGLKKIVSLERMK